VKLLDAVRLDMAASAHLRDVMLGLHPPMRLFGGFIFAADLDQFGKEQA